MFGSCGASAHIWLGKHPAVVSAPWSDDFTIALSCCLPEVRELESINQAFDGNLAFSEGDAIEMSFLSTLFRL